MGQGQRTGLMQESYPLRHDTSYRHHLHRPDGRRDVAITTTTDDELDRSVQLMILVGTRYDGNDVTMTVTTNPHDELNRLTQTTTMCDKLVSILALQMR